MEVVEQTVIKREVTPRQLHASFVRSTLKRRGEYSVNPKTGQLSGVSLIQVGEAKGHGLWIDQRSLETALKVLGDVLPAYVTHEGAVETDRLLHEVGVFSEFYIEAGKLKAETFQALDSFRDDEPERFNRLFDIASAMPDSFGLSLVFEADLVWILEDGTEAPIDTTGTKDMERMKLKREAPSVRFKSIRSADFVDAPAANEEGLFSSHKKSEELKMESDTLKKGEEQEELTDVELEDAPESPEENNEEVETDPLEALTQTVAELTQRVAEQADRIEELQTQLSSSESKNETLSALVAGEEAIPEGDSENTKTESLLERFNNASPADQFNIWKQNKVEILRTARTN